MNDGNLSIGATFWRNRKRIGWMKEKTVRAANYKKGNSSIL